MSLQALQGGFQNKSNALVPLPPGHNRCAFTGERFHESERAFMGLRLAPEDVVGELDRDGNPIPAGHGIAASSTVEHFREKIAKRLSVGNDPSSLYFQEHCLRSTGMHSDDIAKLLDSAKGQKAAVDHLKKIGLTAEADKVAASLNPLAEEVKRRNVNVVQMCGDQWTS